MNASSKTNRAQKHTNMKILTPVPWYVKSRIYGRNRVLRRIKEVVMTIGQTSAEVSPMHFLHANNHNPHFPACAGVVDTFPVWEYQGDRRYQPKYSRPVGKFQIVATNIGFICQLAGPFVGTRAILLSTAVFLPNFPPVVTFSGTRRTAVYPVVCPR